jgi:DNA (cytosine-5)-methyltransferase 1
VCYVERDIQSAAILAARMADGRLDAAPVWSDLATFDGAAWRGAVDLVVGGYPCQDFSVAGKRAGFAGQRGKVWHYVRDIVAAVQPQWCLFENVAGHLSLGFDVVARELQALGYGVTAALVTAAEVGAPHRRERLFILADAARISGPRRRTMCWVYGRRTGSATPWRRRA